MHTCIYIYMYNICMYTYIHVYNIRVEVRVRVRVGQQRLTCVCVCMCVCVCLCAGGRGTLLSHGFNAVGFKQTKWHSDTTETLRQLLRIANKIDSKMNNVKSRDSIADPVGIASKRKQMDDQLELLKETFYERNVKKSQELAATRNADDVARVLQSSTTGEGDELIQSMQTVPPRPVLQEASAKRRSRVFDQAHNRCFVAEQIEWANQCTCDGAAVRRGQI